MKIKNNIEKFCNQLNRSDKYLKYEQTAYNAGYIAALLSNKLITRSEFDKLKLVYVEDSGYYIGEGGKIVNYFR